MGTTTQKSGRHRVVAVAHHGIASRSQRRELVRKHASLTHYYDAAGRLRYKATAPLSKRNKERAAALNVALRIYRKMFGKEERDSFIGDSVFLAKEDGLHFHSEKGWEAMAKSTASTTDLALLLRDARDASGGGARKQPKNIRVGKRRAANDE